MKKWWATIQALKVILSFLEEFYFKYIIHFFDSFFHGLVDIFVNSLSNFYAKFFIDILFCREINSLQDRILKFSKNFSYYLEFFKILKNL